MNLASCSTNALEPAQQIANMLRERIYQYRFVWEDKTFSISVSIGLVVLDADTQSLASVLSAAYAMPPKQRAESRACIPT